MPKEWIVLCSVALLKSDGSCCWSLQMSDRERIAPIALYKRSTVSDSFRLILTEERWERFTGGSSVDLYENAPNGYYEILKPFTN